MEYWNEKISYFDLSGNLLSFNQILCKYKMKSINEIAVLTEEEKSILNKCKKAVKEIDDSAEIILYGSRARGDAKTESDYDLLILVDGDVNLEKEDILCRQLYPIELESGKTISAFVFNHQNWNAPLNRAVPFYKNIDREGIIL